MKPKYSREPGWSHGAPNHDERRQLIGDLRQAGFVRVPGGKGSHQKWRHPGSNVIAIVSGSDEDDAKPYQERQVMRAIRESQENA